MNKRILAALAISLAYFFVAPALANNVIQIWVCELHEGKTGADAVDVSEAWLKAARSVAGGEDLDVLLRLPIAANVADDSFRFVLIAPDARSWGTWFENSSTDVSLAQANDTWNEVAFCSGSSMWAGVPIE
jgi:hypothetical protein